MSVANVLKAYTLEEFNDLPSEEGWDYELIDGVVLMSPRPSVQHQVIAGNIYFGARQTLASLPCQPIKKIDLILQDNNFIPDLMIICNDPLEGANHKKPPLIVIEILSPSSVSRDYVLKRRKYDECGISEY